MRYIYILIALCSTITLPSMAQSPDHAQDVTMLEREIERKGFSITPFSDTVTFVFKQKPIKRLKPEEISTDWRKIKVLFKGTDYTINPFKGDVPKVIAHEKHVRYLELASHKYMYIIGIEGQRIFSVYEVKINVPTDAPPH